MLRKTSLLGLFLATALQAAPTTLNFENGPLGEWIPEWEEEGVTFTLAWAPTKSKAQGSLTFFPYLGTERKGILCAMADEPIPVEARFPKPVSKVSVTFWAHTGSAARLEALSAEGEILDTDSLSIVPSRSDPADPVPQFKLSVSAKEIAAIRFSGPREGEFLAADQLVFE